MKEFFMLLMLRGLYCIDPNHFYGHGGVSHGDSGHPGYNTQGGMGGAFSHHMGSGTHDTDTGTNGILFTKDVVHHGDGKTYVSGDEDQDEDNIDKGLNLDNIHNKIGNAVQGLHDASIAKKKAQQQAEELKASIAQEEEQKRQEELEHLKNLDDQAAQMEHKKPEVLGKRTIPIANFPEESIPLMHHIRDIANKIETIKQTERKNIEAQKKITRLDDVTDLITPQNALIEDPPIYKAFQNAGNLSPYKIYIPVLENTGRFYVNPPPESEAHDIHGVPMRENTSADGHSHFVDHGDKPIPGPAASMASASLPLSDSAMAYGPESTAASMPRSNYIPSLPYSSFNLNLLPNIGTGLNENSYPPSSNYNMNAGAPYSFSGFLSPPPPSSFSYYGGDLSGGNNINEGQNSGSLVHNDRPPGAGGNNSFHL